MNSAISSVIRNHTSNPATANKLESETIKSAAEMSGGQNNAVESSVSSKYDTLDLSKEYVKYKTLSQNTALHDQTSQLNSTVIRQLTIGKSKEEKEKDQDQEEEEKEEEKNEEPVSTYHLYSYTETELMEMMNNGTISRQEYEEEIAGRASSFVGWLNDQNIKG